MVYLPRSTHTAYIFKDDVLTAQESVEYRDVFPKTLFPGVSSYNQQVDSAGNRYQFRLANIVRVAPDGQATTLIRRSPLYCIFGHFSFYWICTLLFFLMLIVPAVIVDMKEKKKAEAAVGSPINQCLYADDFVARHVRFACIQPVRKKIIAAGKFLSLRR